MKRARKIGIAVVDDAPFIREVVRHIAEQNENLDFIGEAEDGVQAIELAKAYDIDVIIMDIVMPQKNGIEATSEILEIKPKTKIIACSTVDQESMVMQALDAGCCSYLTKPFDAEKLTNLITKSMNGDT